MSILTVSIAKQGTGPPQFPAAQATAVASPLWDRVNSAWRLQGESPGAFRGRLRLWDRTRVQKPKSWRKEIELGHSRMFLASGNETKLIHQWALSTSLKLYPITSHTKPQNPPKATKGHSNESHTSRPMELRAEETMLGTSVPSGPWTYTIAQCHSGLIVHRYKRNKWLLPVMFPKVLRLKIKTSWRKGCSTKGEYSSKQWLGHWVKYYIVIWSNVLKPCHFIKKTHYAMLCEEVTHESK